RVGNDQPFDRGNELLDERFEDRTFDKNATAGAAILAGIGENAQWGGFGGANPIGVGKNDIGGFAAQLERYPFEIARRQFHGAPPDFRRPGERDLANQRVGNQRLAGRGARAGNHLQHTQWQASLVGQFAQQKRGER